MKEKKKEIMGAGIYLRSANAKIDFSATTMVAGTTNTSIESSIAPRYRPTGSTTLLTTLLPSVVTNASETDARRKEFVSFVVILRSPTIVPSKTRNDVTVALDLSGIRAPVMRATTTPSRNAQLPTACNDPSETAIDCITLDLTIFATSFFPGLSQ